MLFGEIHRTVLSGCIHSIAAQPAQDIPPKPKRTGNKKDAEGMVWYFRVENLRALGLNARRHSQHMHLALDVCSLRAFSSGRSHFVDVIVS